MFDWLRKKKPLQVEKEIPALTPDADTVTPELELPVASERLEDTAELARRVRLLLTAFYPGQEPDAVAESVLADIADIVEEGFHLSKDEWNAILSGAPGSCDDEKTLSALGGVLGVTVPYLTHTNAERDNRIEAQLELVVAFRETGTTGFRACGPRGAFIPKTAEDFRFIANTIRKTHGSSKESTANATVG